jgi:hypothetical protein
MRHRRNAVVYGASGDQGGDIGFVQIQRIEAKLTLVTFGLRSYGRPEASYPFLEFSRVMKAEGVRPIKPLWL